MANVTSNDVFSELESGELSFYNPFLQKLLYGKGIKSKEEAEDFLKPDFEKHTFDPYLLKDMEKAVSRIVDAVKKNEKIIIYSDYDTDGIPGGVVIHDFFKKIGYENFSNYIPDRHDEGFGLNVEAIKSFSEDKVSLIITVDCGIANIKEVELAVQLGMDVIITDHHEAVLGLPKACAIVDPKQPKCTYPNKDICGAGVAFKLVQALVLCFRDSSHSLNALRFTLPAVGWEKWLLDMVGIATLSDMVFLRGENRAFAYYGLLVLRKTPRLGIVRLLSSLRINQRFLNEDDVGFMISPRINAASRMGVPMDAFKLLTAVTEVEADKYIKHLDGINNERKGVVASIVKDLKRRMEERGDEKSVIVMGNPHWKPALLGLACNTLVESYGKPVFLWGRAGKGEIKGSCRAPEKDSVLAIMENADKDSFLEYGGHSASGGFSVSEEMIHFLDDKLNSAYKKTTRLDEKEKDDKYQVSIEDMDMSVYRLLEKLGPFGVGNEKPIFIFNSVSIEGVDFFGKEKQHLKIVLRKGNKGTIPLISFFLPKEKKALVDNLKMGDNINFSAVLEYSFFGYRAELRLRLVDLFV